MCVLALYIYILSELQKEDAEREAQQQKIDDLERLKQEQIERIEAEVHYTTHAHTHDLKLILYYY